TATPATVTSDASKLDSRVTPPWGPSVALAFDTRCPSASGPMTTDVTSDADDATTLLSWTDTLVVVDSVPGALPSADAPVAVPEAARSGAAWASADDPGASCLLSGVVDELAPATSG